MSMLDRSYCATECNRTDCERNLKFHKPENRIYTASMFDNDNPDPMHESCENRYPIPEETKAEKALALLMENNDLKVKLQSSIPRRRVRRVYKVLREILEEGSSEQTKLHVKRLQDFVIKIQNEDEQVAGEEIKASIQYLLSMREVD